ncbi:hypothetical protein PO909_003956 [Leuciscus waleckii]
MPPKKNEEIEKIKKSLDFLSEEISTVSKQQKTIIDLMSAIKELKKQNEEKDKRIASLECRVADMEQHSRMNDIVVSGLETRPRSYASDHNLHGFEQDLDPENNFLNNINNNCCYYSDDQFNMNLKSDYGLSIIHFNSRSLYANFLYIKEYLSHLNNPFQVIAISETWLTSEKGVDYELNGYELNYVNRENKKGGGVALYVDRRLKYKIVKNMTINIDDVMEIITVEINLEKKKKFNCKLCIQSPGSNIEMFMNSMESLFTKNDQKAVFICGDFNIDLLNPNKHKLTDEFIDLMFSMSLFPLITKPSRISSHCATLIDNIFTNRMDNSLKSGLLLNDISDHLPVFVMCVCDHVKY